MSRISVEKKEREDKIYLSLDAKENVYNNHVNRFKSLRHSETTKVDKTSDVYFHMQKEHLKEKENEKLEKLQ